MPIGYVVLGCVLSASIFPLLSLDLPGNAFTALEELALGRMEWLLHS